MNKIVIIGALLFALGCNNSTGDDNSTDTDTTSSDTDDTDDTDTGDTDTYENTGLCGSQGDAIATVDSYQGTEDIYLIANKGDGEDVCRIRMDLNSVGAPEVPCDDCEWAFVLEKSNVQVIADIDGACANGSLNLDADAIAALEGEQVAIGYMAEYLGHIKALMYYNEEAGEWLALGWVTYDSDTGALTYEMSDGYCGY